MVDEVSLPDELRVTARCAEGLVMAIEHVARPVYGVQFHPEAILTEQGHRLLANFARLAGLSVQLPDSAERSLDDPAADFWSLDAVPVPPPLPTAF